MSSISYMNRELFASCHWLICVSSASSLLNDLLLFCTSPRSVSSPVSRVLQLQSPSLCEFLLISPYTSITSTLVELGGLQNNVVDNSRKCLL